MKGADNDGVVMKGRGDDGKWCMKEGTHLHIHKKALTKGPFAEPEGDSKQAPSNTEYNSFK